MPVFNGPSRPKVRNDGGETEIGQTRVTRVIHKNTWLIYRSTLAWAIFWNLTNPLEIAMYYIVRMKIIQTVGDIGYLAKDVSTPFGAVLQKLTRPILSACGCILMYSDSSPPIIQVEISWQGATVIPRRGTIFGCTRCLHTTASW